MTTASPTKPPRDDTHGGTETTPLFNPSDDLEQSYNADNSDYDPLNPASKASRERKKSLSPDEIQNAEDDLEKSYNADNSDYDPLNPASKAGSHDRVGKGFNPADTFMPLTERTGKLFSGLFKSKKARRAGISGIIVGGAIFALSIVQGPLQFIHLAQLLQKFHFSANYDATDDRFGKLSRYIYHRSHQGVYRTNLGFFQNKYADKIAKKLKAAGIESEYNSRFGWKERTRINPELFGEGKLSPKEIVDRVQSKTLGKTKVYIENGKVYINHDDMGGFKNRSLEKYLAREAGYSRIMAAMNGRVMSRRANFALHPFQKLDRKALKELDKAYTNYKKKRAKSIGHGNISITAIADPKTNPNATDAEKQAAQNNAGETASHVEDILGETSQAQNQVAEGDSAGGVSGLRDSIHFKLTLGATAVAGVACLAKSLDQHSDGIKQAQVVEPLIRTGLDAMSVGSQEQTGQDFNIEQLSFQSKQLHGVDSSGKKTSYNQARSMLGEQNKKNSGVEEDETLKTISKGSPFAFLNKGAAGDALAPVCSAPGQAAQFAIGLLGGPVSAIVGAGIGAAIGPTVENELAKWLAGAAVDPLATGADYGNNVNYGARLAANSQAASDGGRALSNNEAKTLAAFEAQSDKEELQGKSLAYRLFNLYDVRSLASIFIDRSGPIGMNISQLFANILSPFKTFSSLLQPITSRVGAADNSPYNYGFPRIGFSIDEMNDPAVENPYQNAEDVVTRILPAHSDYIDRAKKCFGAEIDPTTYLVTPSLSESPTLKDMDSQECSDSSKDWMQLRFYVFDNQTVLSAACYEGDEDACAEIGQGSGTSAEQATSPAGDLSIEKYSPFLSSPGGKINPKGITLHWWGADSGGRGIDALVDALRGNRTCGAGGCSVQFAITNDGKIYQMTANEDDLTYHAKGGNQTTFGIEMEGGPNAFGQAGKQKYPQKFEAAVYLVKYLMNKYNIPINGSTACQNVSGVHPHKAYNHCGETKTDIDTYYFNEIIKAVGG